jgi:MoxR-like ATPase
VLFRSNALLDVLGNRSFTVPHLDGKTIRAGDDAPPPLIVITTNEERELPPAFVRRCVVLNLSPPDDEAAFKDWLIARGCMHAHLRIAEAAADFAARQVWADRRVAADSGFPKPGLAEYIDLLTALHELTADIDDLDRLAEAQIGWLKRLSAYALVKHPDQNQRRDPEPQPSAPTDESSES